MDERPSAIDLRTAPARSPSIDAIDVTFDDALDEGEAEELELTDDDFVLVEASPPPISRSMLRAALIATAIPASNESHGRIPKRRPRERERAATSRLAWDEDKESDVADECLATIAAEASRSRGSDPFLSISPIAAPSSSVPFDLAPRSTSDRSSGTLPPASSRPWSTPAIPPPASSSRVSLGRLPPVSAPPFRSPFARTSRPQLVSAANLDDCVETLPRPLKPFARRVPDGSDLPRSRDGEATSGSITPVALGRTDGAIIVLAERRRTAWLLASAAVGALVAVTTMRFIVPTATLPSALDASEHAETETTAATQPLPSTPIVAPSTRHHAGAPAVVRFSEADGVSINVTAAPAPPTSAPAQHATPPAAQHAATPAAPAAKPPARAPARNAKSAPTPKVSAPIAMPDGTLGLANNTSSGKAAAAPPIAPAPATPRKHPLTPEQELAEAQLRAALR